MGLFKRHGTVIIAGTQRGSIQHGNRVLIKRSGQFYGKIKARSVGIAGSIHGDVIADELIIYRTGQLYYTTLDCPRVSLRDGGTMSYVHEERAPEDSPPNKKRGTEGEDAARHSEVPTVAEESLCPGRSDRDTDKTRDDQEGSHSISGRTEAGLARKSTCAEGDDRQQKCQDEQPKPSFKMSY